MSTRFASLAVALQSAAATALLAYASAASALAIPVIIVPGNSDPYLAGMPAGSTASSGDTAPAESPVQVTGLPLFAGDVLTFTATGCASNGPGGCSGDPDGGGFISHFDGAQNGISNISAPLNSLLGVFLGPTQPDANPAPAGLDFAVIGLNFPSLSPLLQQLFFIGDGLTGTGSGSSQQFVVPSGATRLFLGTMDGFGWFNNSGEIAVTITSNAEPGVPGGNIPVPGTLWLMLTAGVLLLRRRG